MSYYEKLSEKFLNSFESCSGGLAFAKRNGLIGFPLIRFGEVKGDYNYYANFIQVALSFGEHDDLGRLVAMPRTKYEYLGNTDLCTKVINDNGSFFAHKYDGSGNKIQTDQYNRDGVRAIRKTIYRSFDCDGNLIKEKSPGCISTIVYNSLKQKVHAISETPDGKRQETKYEYTKSGKLAKEHNVVDDFGYLYDYDELDRLVTERIFSRSLSGAELFNAVTAYTYHGDTNVVKYEYDLGGSGNGTGTVYRAEYDEVGNNVQEVKIRPDGSYDETERREFVLVDGRLSEIRITYPDGETEVEMSLPTDW